MTVKKNDTVIIITGKDKGKSGKVIKVIPKRNKVLVEGLNKYKRHIKKTNDNPGGIVELERPIDRSNVKVVEK